MQVTRPRIKTAVKQKLDAVKRRKELIKDKLCHLQVKARKELLVQR